VLIWGGEADRPFGDGGGGGRRARSSSGPQTVGNEHVGRRCTSRRTTYVAQINRWGREFLGGPIKRALFIWR